MKSIKAAAMSAMMLGSLCVFAGGCARDRTYADDRPPTDSLVEGNTGLQAKDVVSATDHMANDLLTLPELNQRERELENPVTGTITKEPNPQWTIVITNVENHSTDPMMNYDTFSQRLRGNLARLGRGRVALIENRAKYKKLQDSELEPGPAFDSGDPKPSQNISPDYGLYITIDEMPNRASSYFLVTATLTNLKNRVQVWNSQYEVQTAR
jgi:Peptidoglycan-synthase activator LpoB